MKFENDWRSQGQEKYLSGVQLFKRKYAPFKADWQHDHCEFCGAKFSQNGDNDLTEGYTTEDGYHWVCVPCFEDFKENFKWKVIDATGE